MNNERRKKVERVKTSIDELRSDIETLQSEEQDAFDNMPENMQQSERGEKTEAAADALQSAKDSCDEIMGFLDTAIE